MSTITRMPGCYVEDGIVYPDDDGVEMGDNSAQSDWITFLSVNLKILYADDPQVAVMSNMNWYPVKGKNKIYRAPDVMVAFGRSKEFRGSYIQWAEDNIPPQVVFEILSPSNAAKEMAEKFKFYEKHGVEEYYVHNPERKTFNAWLRQGPRLHEEATQPYFVSPRMRIRFENTMEFGLKIYRPDGLGFVDPVENGRDGITYMRDCDNANRRTALAEWERIAAERARDESDQARAAAEDKAMRIERERDEIAAAKARIEAAASAEIESLRERLRQAGLE